MTQNNGTPAQEATTAPVAETASEPTGADASALETVVGDSSEKRTYTVIGAWVEDEPVPFGVIEGEHQVAGGDAGSEAAHQPWATSVEAVDVADAEQLAVEEMRS